MDSVDIDKCMHDFFLNWRKFFLFVIKTVAEKNPLHLV